MLKVNIGQMHLRDKPRDSFCQLDQNTTHTIRFDDQFLDRTRDGLADGDIFDAEEGLFKDVLLKGEKEQSVQGIVAHHPAGVNRAGLVRTTVFEQGIDLAVLDPRDVNKPGDSFNANIHVEPNAGVHLDDGAALNQGRAGEHLQGNTWSPALVAVLGSKDITCGRMEMPTLGLSAVGKLQIILAFTRTGLVLGLQVDLVGAGA